VLLVFSIAAPLPWLVLHLLDIEEPPPGTVALATGVAILGAAFLLSWAVELAERDIPQSLALLILALVSVLPEYAVDLAFAVKAAEDPTWLPYPIANMTGANRLLIGFGWAAVVLVACRRDRTSVLAIPHPYRLEIRFLLITTLYSFLIPLSGSLSLFDAAVLLGIFFWYAVSAARGHSEEVDLLGPAAMLDDRTDDRSRHALILGFLFFSAYAIVVAAEPFASSLVTIGRSSAIEEFVLIQWVAPMASESPEFLVAIMFAWRHRGAVGLGALISSKVNQWTLLVGALPIAYAIALGEATGLPLDARQSQELWLTSAQSLLATLLICNFGFSRLEAIVLAVLFGVQLFFPSTEVRIAFTMLYLGLFGALLMASPERRRAFIAVMKPEPASD
jgi:cation:H+ antiporter